MIILETDRLILRELEKKDFSALYDIFSDHETMQFYPKTFSEEKTNTWIKNNQERYNSWGFGLWAVCFKETGECIGDCGLIKQKFYNRTEIEIGYHIHKKLWNKGYATEAALACKQFGFYKLGMNKLISIIKPGNKPSICVAEKIGFTKEKEEFLFGNYYEIYSEIK